MNDDDGEIVPALKLPKELEELGDVSRMVLIFLSKRTRGSSRSSRGRILWMA